MKIVFCAAEAAPFAKVGGLGDVVGSLPQALTALGDEVIVCLPRYGLISTDALTDTGKRVSILYEADTFVIRILEATFPGTHLPIYFFDNETLFGQFKAVYPQGDSGFEVQRFQVFGDAIFAFLKLIDFQPDILHLHDWHTAPMALTLRRQQATDNFYAHTGSVLSIHNMAYQGIHGTRNCLVEGLTASDALIAVSPTYAEEIQTNAGSAGLTALVQSRKAQLYGILNGIDMAVFNPKTDVFLPQKYDETTVEIGKAVAKAQLQHELDLPQTPQVPVFGMVTRLVEQKGLDLFEPIIDTLATLPAQFVIVGTGDGEYEDRLRVLNQETPNVRSRIEFNMALGQLVYAGSDLFLMPSHFEPCGLGQLIALRYGTVPLVRATGGLADTVFDVADDPQKANGFAFKPYTPEALLETIERAMTYWQAEKARAWWPMVQKSMGVDMSWQKSAKAYQAVYKTIQLEHQTV